MNGTAATYWMVRAGEGGFRFEEFQSQSQVTISWHEMGNLSTLNLRTDFQQLRGPDVPVCAGNENGRPRSHLQPQ